MTERERERQRIREWYNNFYAVLWNFLRYLTTLAFSPILVSLHSELNCDRARTLKSNQSCDYYWDWTFPDRETFIVLVVRVYLCSVIKSYRDAAIHTSSVWAWKPTNKAKFNRIILVNEAKPQKFADCFVLVAFWRFCFSFFFLLFTRPTSLLGVCVCVDLKYQYIIAKSHLHWGNPSN